ncbi:MAG: thiamine diphosphokinase [Bacteroidaceae bacterium]|nr:thiamine diphosphokinase [Bacteroidaceae bacterium]
MNTIDPYKYPATVILGNGDYPCAHLPLEVLDKAHTIVICDGAANSYVPTGKPFDIIIGDGDSIADDIRKQHASRIIISTCQETNDQTKAVKYLLEKGIRQLAIVGATGKRDDHTLGNISLLIEYFKQGVMARIYTDHGVFIPAQGNTTLLTHPGQQISIFNFGCTQLSAQGLQYPIRPFDSWWQGTLNEATADRCIITADGMLLIYVAY